MTPVAEEILALRASDGMLYPSVIVDWARQNPGSALHNAFQWDVEAAAYEHWLWRARQLIAVHVTDASGDRTTISLTIDRIQGGGYRDLGSVLSNAEMRQQAVNDALNQLRRWRDRHGYLARDLAVIFRAIERVAPALRDDRDAAD